MALKDQLLEVAEELRGEDPEDFQESFFEECNRVGIRLYRYDETEKMGEEIMEIAGMGPVTMEVEVVEGSIVAELEEEFYAMKWEQGEYDA